MRRRESHDVSLDEREDALRIVGRSAGQETFAGAYPLGALGRARGMTPSAVASILRFSFVSFILHDRVTNLIISPQPGP